MPAAGNRVAGSSLCSPPHKQPKLPRQRWSPQWRHPPRQRPSPYNRGWRRWSRRNRCRRDSRSRRHRDRRYCSRHTQCRHRRHALTKSPRLQKRCLHRRHARSTSRRHQRPCRRGNWSRSMTASARCRAAAESVRAPRPAATGGGAATRAGSVPGVAAARERAAIGAVIAGAAKPAVIGAPGQGIRCCP